MLWMAGRYGGGQQGLRPRGGRPLPGLDAAWTSEWPAAKVRSARDGSSTVVVVGDCGADDRQLRQSLTAVRSGAWRSLTRWPGSYLTIARHGQNLAVIGDLAGQHPVYWKPFDGGTWWSTSACALAALDESPLDPAALAAHLALAQPDVLATRSLFRGIARIPTGHLLLITPARVQATRYEPVEYPTVGLRDAGPTVRAALTEAVEVRLDGRPVSADLAGLDSTTLACLAARRGPVTAVTFADARLRDDDLAYATRTAAAVPNLHHHPVPGGPNTTYYSGLEDLTGLPVTDSPNAYVATAGIKRAVLDAVGEHHAQGVHFTGSAGDGVVWAGPDYLADLLRTRCYRHAARDAARMARLREKSVWTMLAQARPAAGTDLAGAWRHIVTELRSSPRAWTPHADRPLSWTPLLATGDWMTEQARHQLADVLAVAADDLADAPTRMAAWTERQNLVTVGTDVAGWREITQHWHGIDLAAPYLDNEVIRACLAVPAEQRGTPDRYKPLLASAFAGTGVVPDFVLQRSTKGGFEGVAYPGLTEHAAILRDLLGASSQLAGLGLLTPAPVFAMLERAATGQATAMGALHQLVATEVWLRQLDTLTASWWKDNARVATA